MMRWVLYLLSFAALPIPTLAEAQTSTRQATLDWDLVLKALGFVVAGVAAYVQTRGLYFASRTSLKTDLEILKLLDAADPNYQVVKSSIDARLARLYQPRAPATMRANVQRWAVAAVGLVWAVGFSYWTFALVRPGFTWWSLLTGYLAFGGAALALQGAVGTGFIMRSPFESRADRIAMRR